MKRVIIVHGWSGSPNGDWIPWLKSQLEKYGYEAVAPEMPDTDNPTIEKWVEHLSRIVGTPNEETFFVGHSIGCQTILRYLDARLPESSGMVGGAVFVAGWFYLENMESIEEGRIAKPWIETPINFIKIKIVLPKSTLVISDNDPYDSFEENRAKFSELGSKIVVLHEAGHITAGDGFVEVPAVLSELNQILGGN